MHKVHDVFRPGVPDESMWPHPPEALSLGRDEIHVWRAALSRPDARVQELAATLTPDEVERAGRFYFENNRKHFIVARGLLRCLPGRYLGVEPHALRFRYGSYGKPELTGESGGGRIRFNVSHSNDLVIYPLSL